MCEQHIYSDAYFADAFIQNDMNCIQYIDFDQFMHQNPWPWHFLRVLTSFLSIYNAPNKHGKKVTYPFLDAKPKYLVENICIWKYFNKQHMKTSIRNAKVSSTYENECETLDSILAEDDELNIQMQA